MSANPPFHRPVAINPDSWQARGLIAWWPFAARRYDPLYGQAISMTRTAGVGIEGRAYGTGLVCNALTQGLVAAAPAAYQLQKPITLHLVCTFTANPPVWLLLLGCAHNVTNSQPWCSYGITVSSDAASLNWMYADAAAGFAAHAGVARPANGRLTIATAVIASGFQDIWINGRSSGAPSAETQTVFYGATPQVVVGNGVPACGVTSNAIVYDARVYNRRLSQAEIMALYNPATRWDLYAPPPRPWYIGIGTGSTGSGSGARSMAVIAG